MLLLKAELDPKKAGTLLQVRAAVERVWSAIHYEEFQATSLTVAPDAATLLFVTAAGQELGVTGSLTVGGAHYERLFREDK